MIIFEGNKLKIGEVKKSGKVEGGNDKLQISLLEHYNDKILIKEGTDLDNIIWAFLNDEHSEALSKSLNYLTKGGSFFEYLRGALEKGSKGKFENADWIEFVSKPVLLEDINKENFAEKYEENWGFTAWRKGENKKKTVTNISSISIHSLLHLPVRQKFEVIVYGEDWNEVGKFRKLPRVSDILEALCYEFYVIRNNEDRLRNYDDNHLSFTDLI